MSARHCAVTMHRTTQLLSQSLCGTESRHKDNARSSAIGKQVKQKKSNYISLAQHHLPALGLFWASFFLRVQLTALLLVSHGFCKGGGCD